MELDSGLEQRLRSHERPSWIMPAVWIATGVAALELCGLFQPLDDLAYDGASRFVVRNSLAPAEVLLIYSSSLSDGEQAADLWALLDKLEALQARHIAVTMPLPRAVRARCAGRARITIGNPVVRDRIEPTVWHPLSAQESSTPVADLEQAVLLPAPRGGIYREQLTRACVEGKWCPTLESAIAARLDRAPPPASQFRLRFRGATGSLPHLTSASALRGGLVPELVRGQVVLIGQREPAGALRISTPTTGTHDPMPVLEFHGHALNTLLTQSTIHSTGPLLNGLIYFAVAIAAGLFFEASAARRGGLFWLVLLAINLCGVLFLLWVARTWLPSAGIAAVQAVCFVRTAQRRTVFAQAAWQQLIQDLYVKLRQHRWPTGFFSEEEPWSQVVSFVHQTLNLNRLIILELPANSFHVQEVKALNCSLAEISEQRRDRRRWPYVAALEEKRPVGLDRKKPFLRQVADEQQYLVPLVFGGEVFGFLALGVACREVASTPQFEDRLAEFADQIAELLYRRHRVLADRQQETSRLRDARAFRELVHATHLLERRVARLENMFDKSLTAAAIYDVFGRLMVLNAKMAELLQNEGVAAVDLSTVDLIALLTKQDQHAARRMLRQVVLGKRHESLPVTLEHPKGDYLFIVRAMDLEVPISPGGTSAPAPLQLQGILCELVDRSEVLRTHRLRAELTEGFGNSLRNDFAAVDLATTLIGDEAAPAEQRRACGEMIHSRIKSALKSLEDFEQLMPQDLSASEAECLPIAPRPALEEAIATSAGQAGDRGIQIRLGHSPLTSQVFVVPNLLPRVVAVILEFLLLDARDESQLRVDLEETPDEVVIAFSNEGFGVAVDSVRGLLEQDGITDTPESRNLRECLDWVHTWGGRMTASSEIGAGTSLKLILRKFH